MKSKIALIILVVGVVAVILYQRAVVAEHPDYAPDVMTDIREIDGVLYFPDGVPVRNYEQMELYIQSHE